jgi:hypothetical protein
VPHHDGMPVAWIAGTALAMVLLIYGRSLNYDLYWDDIQVLRPWSAGDLAHTWTGIYRPLVPVARFYRPLTSLFYATAFNLFGLNTWPLHALCLANLAGVATLAGVFIYRETNALALGLFGAALCAADPDLATSIGPWISNQDHAFVTMAALAALLWWQSCRTSPLARWWPLILPMIAASWLKEDGLMLPFVIAGVHEVRARIVGDVPPLSGTAWLWALGLFGALFAWREYWLGGIGGYGFPSLSEILRNLQRGPRDVLFRQIDPAAGLWWPVAVKWVGLAGGAFACWRARTSAHATLVLTGLTIVIVADVPLSQISSVGRWYLLALGSVLIVAGGLAYIGALMRTHLRAHHVLLALGSIAAVSAFGWDARVQAATFAPCSEDTREHERMLVSDASVPREIREWLASSSRDCQLRITRALPVITYDDHAALGRVTSLITTRGQSAALTLRAPFASADNPVDVFISLDDHVVRSLRLISAEWRDLEVPLGAVSLRAWLRQAHRLDAGASGPRNAGLEFRPIRVQ